MQTGHRCSRPSRFDDDTGAKIENSADQIVSSEDPKVGVSPIRRYVERMEQNEATRGIIVVKDNVTPL